MYRQPLSQGPKIQHSFLLCGTVTILFISFHPSDRLKVLTLKGLNSKSIEADMVRIKVSRSDFVPWGIY